MSGTLPEDADVGFREFEPALLAAGLVRFLYRSAGMRFDAHPLVWYRQYHDTRELSERLWSSLPHLLAGAALAVAVGIALRTCPAGAAEAVWGDGADFTRPRAGARGATTLIGLDVRAGVPGVRLARRQDPIVALGKDLLLGEHGSAVREVALACAPSKRRTLVVWSSDNEVRAALLGPQGETLAGAGGAIAPQGSGNGRAAVAWSPGAERWLAVWPVSRPPGISGRLVNVKGVPVGREIRLPVQRGAQPYNPAVAHSVTSREFLVVWQELARGGWSIYARRVGEDGLPKDPRDILICGAAGACTNPAVAWDPETDTFLVVWHDERDGAGEIYARTVGADGQRLGTERDISLRTATQEHFPAVAWLTAAHRFLVAWDDYRERTVSIWARTLSVNGEPDPEIQITSGSQNRLHPRIAADERGARWAVVWMDGRISYQRWGTYLRVVDSSGAPREELDVSDSPLAQYNQDAAWDPDAGWFVAAWSQPLPENRFLLRGRRVGGAYVPDGAAAGLRVDSGVVAPRWEQVLWEGRVPDGTEVLVRLRTAATEGGLAKAGWSSFITSSPAVPQVPRARWLEMELRLRSSLPWDTPEVRRLLVRYSRR